MATGLKYGYCLCCGKHRKCAGWQICPPEFRNYENKKKKRKNMMCSDCAAQHLGNGNGVTEPSSEILTLAQLLQDVENQSQHEESNLNATSSTDANDDVEHPRSDAPKSGTRPHRSPKISPNSPEDEPSTKPKKRTFSETFLEEHEKDGANEENRHSLPFNRPIKKRLLSPDDSAIPSTSTAAANPVLHIEHNNNNEDKEEKSTTSSRVLFQKIKELTNDSNGLSSENNERSGSYTPCESLVIDMVMTCDEGGRFFPNLRNLLAVSSSPKSRKNFKFYSRKITEGDSNSNTPTDQNLKIE